MEEVEWKQQFRGYVLFVFIVSDFPVLKKQVSEIWSKHFLLVYQVSFIFLREKKRKETCRRFS